MKRNMGMTRAGAYLIDTWICGAILAVCIMPFMLHRFFQEPVSMDVGLGRMSMGWMLILSAGAILLYSIVGDFLGGTIGKRILGIRLQGNGGPIKTLGFAVKHGLIKVVLSLVWPISAVYCLSKDGHLFYDHWLNVELIDIKNR